MKNLYAADFFGRWTQGAWRRRRTTAEAFIGLHAMTTLSSPRSRNWVPLRAVHPLRGQRQKKPPVAAGPMGWELVLCMLIARKFLSWNICNNQAKPCCYLGRAPGKEAGTDIYTEPGQGFLPLWVGACADLGDSQEWRSWAGMNLGTRGPVSEVK